MIEKRNAYILIRKPEERRQLGKTILDGIILTWILKEKSVREWNGFIWPNTG
jgi:hypothetical protein